MSKTNNILVDQFGRRHNYLRISLTEKCNLRCTYCMPAEGIKLSPQSHLMSVDEIYQIAKKFVDFGVNKIRLTGGEPLVRKEFSEILKNLSTLNTTLSITTNGVLADRFIDDFKTYNLNNINVSLDSLQEEKFKFITRRDHFKKAYDNIFQLVENGFKVKINVVLIKGFNDDEILDFIRFTESLPISVRFIEFMPFDGNDWNKDKLVTQKDIIDKTEGEFGKNLIKLEDHENFISRDYKISGFEGEFGIISTVSNPFCDGCNRIRLTADGKIKNCLFSNLETNLLAKLRRGESLDDIIHKSIYKKKAVRAGMSDFNKLNDPDLHTKNRSMIAIGG